MKEINNFQLSLIPFQCPVSTLQIASSQRTTLLYEESKAMSFLTFWLPWATFSQNGCLGYLLNSFCIIMCKKRVTFLKNLLFVNNARPVNLKCARFCPIHIFYFVSVFVFVFTWHLTAFLLCPFICALSLALALSLSERERNWPAGNLSAADVAVALRDQRLLLLLVSLPFCLIHSVQLKSAEKRERLVNARSQKLKKLN